MYRVLTATDPLGHTTTIARDALGQAISAADPLGHKTSFTYAPNGNLAIITEALS